MALEFPKGMDECLYFTNREMDGVKIIAWVKKKECPECGKAKMGKPVKDDGKVSIRAKEYLCPECGYQEEKKEHEESCNAEIQYTCMCGHQGEATTPYVRKSFEGVKAIVFNCDGCGKKLGVTKKMKEGKKK